MLVSIVKKFKKYQKGIPNKSLGNIGSTSQNRCNHFLKRKNDQKEVIEICMKFLRQIMTYKERINT